MREVSYDTEEITAYIADNEYKLFENQLGVYEIILSSIEVVGGALVFHSPG